LHPNLLFSRHIIQINALPKREKNQAAIGLQIRL
jgi:hypothetical protein